MRAVDVSPDRRNRLVPVPGRANIKALVPPPCPRTLDRTSVVAGLVAAEKAIASTAAIAKLLPRPDLVTRSLERREAVLSSQIEAPAPTSPSFWNTKRPDRMKGCPTMPG